MMSALTLFIAATDGTLLGATPGTDAWLAHMGAYEQVGYTMVYALLARLAADMSRDGGDRVAARDIAATLYVSPYTARDHLKAIYGKTRFHTRQELAARLGGTGP